MRKCLRMKPIVPSHRLADFRMRLLKWFRRHKRDMPWRRSRYPYRIWVAEVMLQQTRIAAVMPYYSKFLRRFPSVRALARATNAEVLQYWSGLGYYSRARNLHRAAREIVSRHSGKFPNTYEAALELPGIGRYTAAAVLSIAYGSPLAVLDGNVARILARLGALRGDLREPKRWKELENVAEALLAKSAPGDWNQALMELGETICTPRSPHCETCPVAAYCAARKRGLVEKIPDPRKKPAAVRMAIAAAVLRDPEGRTLLVQDPGAHDHVLFSRMWQFPAVEVRSDARRELLQRLQETLGFQVSDLEELPSARHGVTFRNVTLLPFLASVASLPAIPRSCAVPLEKIGDLPISSATRKIAAAAMAR
jgi:A/G-specific adenine glycosylase